MSARNKLQLIIYFHDQIEIFHEKVVGELPEYVTLTWTGPALPIQAELYLMFDESVCEPALTGTVVKYEVVINERLYRKVSMVVLFTHVDLEKMSRIMAADLVKALRLQGWRENSATN